MSLTQQLDELLAERARLVERIEEIDRDLIFRRSRACYILLLKLDPDWRKRPDRHVLAAREHPTAGFWTLEVVHSSLSRTQALGDEHPTGREVSLSVNEDVRAPYRPEIVELWHQILFGRALDT